MKPPTFIFTAFFVACLPLSGYGGFDLEKIVVTAPSFSSSDESSRQNYSSESVYSEETARGAPDAIDAPLEYIGGFDLRRRGPMGVQADPSLRGSTYEEVAVLVDGVKVMDPQTGHFNLDIPLTPFDVERVDCMKEASSAFYGAGAFAGAVNYIVKKPAKNSVKIQYFYGEHALQEEAISLARVYDSLAARVSYEHGASKAARPNTDFEYRTGTFYLDKKAGDFDFDTLLGYQKKDYGADSFYSNLFPEEEEHTQTLFTRTGAKYDLSPGWLQENFYFRQHRDKFILARNNPTSVNYHTTYVYGANSELHLPVRWAEFIVGLDTASEEIHSSNLGKHKRFNQAFFLGFIPDLGDRLSADLRLRTDYYEDWGWNQSFNMGAGFWVIQDLLKARTSVAHAFRVPTFTELFYRDAANQGNSQLLQEESDSVTAGLLFIRSPFSLHIDGYLRKADNVIDWTRFNASSPWQATNLGKIDFKGVECGVAVNPVFSSALVSLDKTEVSYNYGEADRGASGFLSKYALDILRHQVILASYGRLSVVNFSATLSYNQRDFGENYLLVDVVFSKKIMRRGYALQPFVAVDNCADARYSEIGGVLQPGRWVKTGIRIEW